MDDGQKANLSRLLADKGMPPEAPAAAPAAPAAPEAAAPVAPVAPTPTADEAVQTQAAPVTEGDAAEAAPITYKVKFGDQERELSEQQIVGTFDRYRALNERSEEYAPINKLVAAIQKQTGADANQVAKFIAESIAGRFKGGQAGQQANGVDVSQETQLESRNDTDYEAQLKQWEDDNAIALPPGLREALSSTKRMEKQNSDMMKVVAGLLNHIKNGNGTMQAQAQQIEGEKQQVAQNRIAQNLQSVQNRFSFSDDQAADFQQFAMVRGYSLEDFADSELAMTVGQDFQNAVNSGEVARMKGILSKRQAMTGTVPPSAGAGAISAPDSGAAPAVPDALTKMVDRTMKSRNMA